MKDFKSKKVQQQLDWLSKLAEIRRLGGHIIGYIDMKARKYQQFKSL